jgi:hypothetical protein
MSEQTQMTPDAAREVSAIDYARQNSLIDNQKHLESNLERHEIRTEYAGEIGGVVMNAANLELQGTTANTLKLSPDASHKALGEYIQGTSHYKGLATQRVNTAKSDVEKHRKMINQTVQENLPTYKQAAIEDARADGVDIKDVA